MMYKVQVTDCNTNKVVKEIEAANLCTAERVENGLNINLNHMQYFTRIKESQAMKPTNELRFVIRKLHPEQPTDVTTVRILQQKWAVFNQNIIVEQEWRDVPLYAKEQQ